MPADNKSIMRDFLDLRFNKRDIAAFRDYIDESFVGHSPRLGTTTKDDMLRDFKPFHQAISDLRVTIEDMIAEDDRVAVRGVGVGTHSAEITGIPIPATGLEIRFNFWEIWRIENGKLVERWAIQDMKEQLMQAASEFGANNS